MLAAIAAAYVQGMRYDDIRAGLLSFFPSPSTTPGRLNLIRVRGGGRVLVDYAHNAAAIDGLVDFVWHTPAAKRVSACSPCPATGATTTSAQAGRLCAQFDRVIIKEDNDRAGARAARSPRCSARGSSRAGSIRRGSRCCTRRARRSNRGLDLLGEDDLLVIHADEVPGTLAIVRERAVQGA